MRNTGIEKRLAVRNETMTFIEADRMRLRVKDHPFVATIASFVDKRTEHTRADPAASCGALHGHPADTRTLSRTKQQPSGTDTNSTLACDRVDRIGSNAIVAIDLFFDRNRLFADKDVVPQRERFGEARFVFDREDLDAHVDAAHARRSPRGRVYGMQ